MNLEDNSLKLPNSWIMVELADIGKIVSGGTPSTKESSYWGGNISWISPSDLTGYSNKFIGRGTKSITVDGLKNSSAVIMPTGSIHFSSRAPIGYTVISSSEMTTNQGFKSLVPVKGIFNEYVYYYFKSAKQLAESKATGTTFKEISGTAFGKLQIPIPPTNEQHRIVAKIEALFSELDKGIESFKTAREQLKIYRQALLKHAFSGKLTEQWRAENAGKLETAETLLQRIQAEREQRYQQQLKDWETNGKQGSKPKAPISFSPLKENELIDLPELPTGWIYVRAEDISDFITKGTTPSKEQLFAGSGEIPFIKVYNLTKTGHLDFTIEPTFVSKATHKGFLERSKVYPNDVLMNIVGPPLGKVSIVPNSYPEWNINQAIVRFRSGIVDSNYLCSFLLWEDTLRLMSKKTKTTAGQVNLTLEICRDINIPICGNEEQNQILSELELRLSIADQFDQTLTTALQQAETLRQAILKKAFSGQLVPQDPNDEPASVLLERIQAEKTQTNSQATRQRGKN